MERLQLHNNLGQSLVEALVALGAAALIVSAIAVSVISAVNGSDYSKNQNIATTYAQSEMESLGQISRTDWATFSAIANGTYCVGEDNSLGSVVSSCTHGNVNNNLFIRQVDLHKLDTSCTGTAKGTLVNVTVSWSDGKCKNTPYCHEASIQSCFNNINTVSSP